MQKKIKEDLALFNQLAKTFLEQEIQNPVAEYIDPEKVEEVIDIKLKEEGIADQELKKVLENILLKSPKSSSNLFFNQLFGGRNSKAVLGDLLTVLLNNSMATYKIAGPQVSVEKEILMQIYNLIGYNHNSAGTFPTGGSMCNFMSLVMARDRKKAEKTDNSLNKLIAYTSENGHYSVSKNASLSGLGKQNVRHIKSNKKGKIDVIEFERQIKFDLKKGLTPFYLNATAGTTVLCAFDNIEELAPICKKYNIWLHLDGAFGGTVIFSKKHKHLVRGINLTDSFCFNAHKTLGAPISTSILAVKKKDYLYNSFNTDANYLYQTHNEDFNLGRTSFECGRRNNALKLWSMWKSIGQNGIAQIIEQEFKLADFARKYIKNNSDYNIYSFEESLAVCFNYKNFDPEDLCLKLYKSNTLMVGFGCFQEKKFIRLVTVNAENSNDDIIRFFNLLENFCQKNKDYIKKI